MGFNDPLLKDQSHVQDLGALEELWKELSGRGVRVGIYDDGMQVNHPDLIDNYDASLEYSGDSGVNDPWPARDLDQNAGEHGTAVAGLIGAQANNGIGGVGVAYGASLTGIDFLAPEFATDDARADLLRHGEHFDVMNMSIAFKNAHLYHTSVNDILHVTEDGAPASRAAKLHDALGDVAENGRNGLGSVVVKSAGNNRDSNSDSMDGNSAGDGLNNSHYVITVAAHYRGAVEQSSSYGANILVSAPSANVTTDLTGEYGYNVGSENADYAYTFGQTSSAAALVSGTVALMLEANPDLGWRDVQEILMLSARRDEFGQSYTWHRNKSININGIGKEYSQDFGFGAVDTYAAARMAAAWKYFHDEASDSRNLVSAVVSYEGRTELTNRSNVFNINVVDELTIDHVYVTLDLEYEDISSLSLTLTAPTGESFNLMNGYDIEHSIDSSTTFGVAHAHGIESAGNWTVTISDRSIMRERFLNSIELSFEGSEVSEDSIYHFNDELTYEAHLQDESLQIEDVDGGEDWLNFSAMTHNIQVSLLGDGAVYIDKDADDSRTIKSENRQAIIRQPDALEHIHGGSGHDVLIGNEKQNDLIGSKGNDWIEGGGNADFLDGGIGVDRAIYSNSEVGVYLDFIYNERNAGGSEGDILASIEQAEGSSLADDLRGDAHRNYIEGNGGDDTLLGRGGDDVLVGENGNDTLIGDIGDDHLVGGRGNDRLSGGKGDDLLIGNAGDNIYVAASGDDRVFDEEGDASIYGGRGDDQIHAGAGDDWIGGGAGNDIINGGSGDDRIIGAGGSDYLIGGAGADIFVFSVDGPRDRIEHFEIGDQIFIEQGIGEDISKSSIKIVDKGDGGAGVFYNDLEFVSLISLDDVTSVIDSVRII